MAVWSEVNFDATWKDSRLDADYYQPTYLQQSSVITNLPHKMLEEVARISDGNHLTIAEKFLR